MSLSLKGVLRTPLVALATVALLLGSAHPAAAREHLDDLIGGVRASTDASRAAALPDVSMPSGILWTLDGRSLWERDPHAVRAMASTTKIMTALVALESGDPEEVVAISKDAADVGESEVGLRAGQTMSLRELIEATLIRSGNDAAMALAEHVAGSEDAFVARMNDKAVELGLSDTHYANPHGLDESGHRTSATDLASLSLVALSNPEFARIVASPSVSVRLADGSVKKYENSNVLLKNYEGASGIKTGWTDDAGYCLVASADREGIGFVAVVLGAESEKDRFSQARTLLDWGYEHYRLTRLASADQTAALVPVSDYLDQTVTAIVATDALAPVFDLDGPVEAVVDIVSEVEAPVAAGQFLGTLSIRQGERLLAQIPIVAAFEVPHPGLWDTITIAVTRAWRGVFGGPTVAEPVPVL